MKLRLLPLSNTRVSKKGYILHDSKYVTFCERLNYGDAEKLWLPGLKGEGEMNGQNTEDL